MRVNSCAHEILTPSTQGLVGAWNYAFRRSRGDFQECINLYNITSLMDLPEVFERFLVGVDTFNPFNSPSWQGLHKTV